MATTAPPGASVAAQAAPTSGSPSPRVITQEGVTELVKLLNENRTRGDVEKTAVHIGDDEGKEDDTQMYFDVPAEVATALNKVVSPEYLVRSYRLSGVSVKVLYTPMGQGHAEPSKVAVPTRSSKGHAIIKVPKQAHGTPIAFRLTNDLPRPVDVDMNVGHGSAKYHIGCFRVEPNRSLTVRRPQQRDAAIVILPDGGVVADALGLSTENGRNVFKFAVTAVPLTEQQVEAHLLTPDARDQLSFQREIAVAKAENVTWQTRVEVTNTCLADLVEGIRKHQQLLDSASADQALLRDTASRKRARDEFEDQAALVQDQARQLEAAAKVRRGASGRTRVSWLPIPEETRTTMGCGGPVYRSASNVGARTKGRRCTRRAGLAAFAGKTGDSWATVPFLRHASLVSGGCIEFDVDEEPMPSEQPRVSVAAGAGVGAGAGAAPPAAAATPSGATNGAHGRQVQVLVPITAM